MLSTDKNIVVHADRCMQPECAESCESDECKLCRPCLSSDDIMSLHLAYREHVNRGDTKRIFPVSSNNNEVVNNFEELSPKNRLMTKWFAGKCEADSTWCS